MQTLAIIALPFVCLAYFLSKANLDQLYGATATAQARIDFSPQDLSALDVFSLIGLLLLKYVLQYFRKTPSPRPAGNGKEFALPCLTIEAPLHVSQQDVQRFNKAVGGTAESSPTSLLFLPAITTPILSILLANRHSHVLAFGSVNTKNRFEFLDPEACRKPLSWSKAMVTGRFGGSAGRRAKRGMEFDVVIEARHEVQDKGEDELAAFFRQTVTILQYLPKETEPLYEDSKSADQEKEQVIAADGWQEQGIIDISLAAPSSWAAVGKDYNPIHVSVLAAKLFGFPGMIAHGNHAVAMMMQQLQQQSAQCGPTLSTDLLQQLWWTSPKSSFLEVAFRRPMVLPIRLQSQIQSTGYSNNRVGFEIVGDGKVHVSGMAGYL